MKSMLFVLALVIFTLPVSAEPLRQVRLDSPLAQSLAAHLEDSGFDVLWGSVSENSLELIVTLDELELLRRQGYAPQVLAVGRPFREIQDECGAGDPVPPLYPDLSQIVAQMESVAEDYPAICRFVDLTAAYAVTPTSEGRHLYAIKISDNVAVEEDEPAVLMVACNHSREIVTPVLALHAIEQFTTRYGSDPTITALVDECEIWIAPVCNPDGYEYVFNVDNMWRKNRTVFPGGTGVDLNRNYPFGWYNACSGSTDPGSNTYKGPSAGSEAETQTIMALTQEQRFAKVLDYHSSGREVLHGYDCWNHPCDAFLEDEAIVLSFIAGYGGDHRPPSADGEHYEWQLAMGGALAFLMETATEFQPSYNDALAEAELIWPGTVWLLERAIPLWGHVTDATTAEPLEASLSFSGVYYPNGETNTSGGPHGRYHAFLPPGTYDVTFAAAGYDPLTIPGVVITSDGSTRLDAAITPPFSAVVSPPPALARLATPQMSPASLRYNVALPGPVSLQILASDGRLVRTILSRHHSPGRYQALWDGRDQHGSVVPAGNYFCRLEQGGIAGVRKLLLVR